MQAKVTDVHKTLAYTRQKVGRQFMTIAVVTLIFGLLGLYYGPDKVRFAAWIALPIGAVLFAYELFKSLFPGKTLLALSPEGIHLRIEGLKDVLIPWREVRDVDVIDVKTWSTWPGLPVRTKFPRVTVVLVSQDFYNRVIHVNSVLMRGISWDNIFIPRGDLMQIALHHEILPVGADELREAVETRWRAFGDATQTPVLPAASTEPRRSVTIVGRLAIIVPILVFAFLSADPPRLWNKLWGNSSEQAARRAAKEHQELLERVEREFAEVRRARDETNKRLEQTFEPPKGADPKSPPQSSGFGHRDGVTWLALAPDGKSFLSASLDRSVKLWEIGNTRSLRDIGAHHGIVRSVGFLPDGTQALSAGDDGEVVLRALDDGKVLHVFEARENGGANALAISRDGRRAVSGHDAGAIIIWDIENKSFVRALKGAVRPRAVAISADGRHSFAGDAEGKLWLWDIQSGALLKSFNGHRGSVHGVATMSGSMQAVSAGADNMLRLWNLETGEEIRSFPGHTATVYAIAITADGKRILSGSNDRTARLWDVETGKEITRFNTPAGAVYAVAFGADGAILTAGADRSIRLWTANGQAVRVFAGRAN